MVSLTWALTREEIRYRTGHIRDTLAAQVARGGEHAISAVSVKEVDRFLTDIKKVKMDIELLKYSRVHKALIEMTTSGSGWSPAIMWKSEMVLLTWEEELGSLRELRADLWGEGGRLEGLKRAEDLTEDVRHQVESETLINMISPGKGSTHYAPSWEIHNVEERADAFMIGHNGFPIGSWWIKTAAAHRDGIIYGLVHGITADKSKAYAVILTDNEEVSLGDEDRFRYLPPLTDPNRRKLMKNMTIRAPVRVLRTWRLHSDRRPEAGLRYDGLYFVKDFTVKLFEKPGGGDEWSWTFELERETVQQGIEKATCHPTAEEMDDWNDFQKEMADLVQSRNPSGEVNIAAVRQNRDSRYASGRDSTLTLKQ